MSGSRVDFRLPNFGNVHVAGGPRAHKLCRHRKPVVLRWERARIGFDTGVDLRESTLHARNHVLACIQDEVFALYRMGDSLPYVAAALNSPLN